MLEDMDVVLPQIYRFPSLRTLSVIRQGTIAGHGHNTGGKVYGSILDIRTDMLTRLSVSGDVIWRRGSFSGLHELELIFIISLRLVGFDEILRHCAALTSLTIVPTDLTDPDEIFPPHSAHNPAPSRT